MFVNAFVNFKEEWLECLKDKETVAINEEDYERGKITFKIYRISSEENI